MTSEPSRFVVVDDSDPRIEYTGQWSKEDTFEKDLVGWNLFGPSWNRTLHSAQGSSSFSYRFNGTYFIVFGSYEINDTKPAPTVRCAIDNAVVSSNKITPGQRNLFRFCHGPLPSGEHLLTVNVTVPEGGGFWLDHIQYHPMTFPTAGETLKYQDNDASFVYEPEDKWKGGVGASHASNTSGSTITVNFSGTSFAAFGAATSMNPSDGEYTIDGGEPVVIRLPTKIKPSDFDTLYHQPLFFAGNLTPTDHKLVVTFKGELGDGSPLTFDFAHITLPPTPSTETPPPKPKSPVGAIAGGVVGGIVGLLAIILIAVFWWRRSRKKQDVEQMTSTPFLDAAATSPRVPPATLNGMVMAYHPADYSASESHASMISPTESKGDLVVLAPPGLNSVRPLPQIRTHQDSGLRLGPGQNQGNIIDVPPHYTEN